MNDLTIALADCNSVPKSFLDPDIEREAVPAFRMLAMRLEAATERKRRAAALAGIGWTGRKPAFAGAAAREYRSDDPVPRSWQPVRPEAPAVTIEAIIYELREYGAAAFKAPNCQSRLGGCPSDNWRTCSRG